MGTHNIPRNYKGESRILYIFTIKSLITTAIGATAGGILYFIFAMLTFKKIGIVFLALCALVGYVIGAFKIPTVAGIPVTKKIGGEPISEIIIRYLKFKKSRKIYTYIKEEDR